MTTTLATNFGWIYIWCPDPNSMQTTPPLFMKDLPKDNHEGIACCTSGGR